MTLRGGASRARKSGVPRGLRLCRNLHHGDGSTQVGGSLYGEVGYHPCLFFVLRCHEHPIESCRECAKECGQTTAQAAQRSVESESRRDQDPLAFWYREDEIRWPRVRRERGRQLRGRLVRGVPAVAFGGGRG